MAEEEKEHLEEHEAEISRLKERIADLEEKLSERRIEFSPALRWAGWLLGALVAATSLAVIVVFLGGGLSSTETECAEDPLQNEILQEQQQQMIAEQMVRENVDDINGCLEAWATSHREQLVPGWSVILRLDIQAGEGGRVERVEASGDNLPSELGECFEQRVRGWDFPRPGTFQIVLPFAMDGDGGGERPTDGGTGDGGGESDSGVSDGGEEGD